MTVDEFRELASEGVVVECSNLKQRREVIELFKECGYALNPATQSYLTPEGSHFSTVYMHPGFRPSRDCVSCFKTIVGAKDFVAHAIQYEDVRNIIEHPPMLDERSDTEFAREFAALMC